MFPRYIFRQSEYSNCLFVFPAKKIKSRKSDHKKKHPFFLSHHPSIFFCFCFCFCFFFVIE